MTEFIQLLESCEKDTQKGQKVFRHYDMAFSEGRFQEVADELDQIDCARLDPFMVTSVLMATFCATHQLGDARVRFTHRAETRLVELVGPERTRNIMGRQR
jgi:hypothetical protein